MTKRVRKDVGGKNGIQVVRSAGRPVKPAIGDSVDTADRIRARVLKVNKVTSLCEFVRDNRTFRVRHDHLVLTKELPKGRRQFWAPNSSKLMSGSVVAAPGDEEVEVSAEAPQVQEVEVAAEVAA